MQEKAKILVRIRPLLEFQDEPAWLAGHDTIRCLNSKALNSKHSKLHHHSQVLDSLEFRFDRVMEPPITSEKIYKAEIRKMVQQSLRCQCDTTVVAYGQTCAGKTFTLLGIKQSPGFIPCIFRDIFNFEGDKQNKITFKLSYTEIYNETLVDLLNPNAKKLKIVLGEEWGSEVVGAIKQPVKSFQDCLSVLDVGQQNRKYGAKENHDHSSRSHTILKIHIERRNQNLQIMRSTINIVDLAGSERLGQEKGSAETGYINKSLFQFSNVISKLSEEQDQHIPFRDSKLTRLLESSLTKNSQLGIIFCISPALINLSESLSTLRLAQKAKKLRINLVDDKCDETSSVEVSKLKETIRNQEKQIKKLQIEIKKLKSEIEEKNEPEPVIQIKGTVLFDYENFILEVGAGSISQNTPSFTKIKDNLKADLSNTYCHYAKQITKHLLREQMRSEWVQIQEMALKNVLLFKEKLQPFRMAMMRQLSEYISSNPEKIMLKKYLVQASSGQSSKRISPKLQRMRLGNSLAAWGCKKDCRVFVTAKVDQYGVSEIKKEGKICKLTAGTHHSLVCFNDGKVQGWGKNDRCQIASQEPEVVDIPRLISIPVRIKSVAAGCYHSLALSESGKVLSWGTGEDGQLGHGPIQKMQNPTQLIFDWSVPAVQVYAGHSHSGFLDQSGSYFAFGFNQDYRLMVAEDKIVSYPTQVKIGQVTKAALGVTHTCLLTQTGKVYCGGIGSNGELGMQLQPSITGYETIEAAPKTGVSNREEICPIVEVEYFGQENPAIDISCGENVTAVINSQNQLFTFGKTSYERLGHNQRGIKKILNGVNRVVMGYRHGFAWYEGKPSLYGWGFNMYNQIGTLQARDIKSPQLLDCLNSKSIIGIGAGFFHSVALCQ